MRSCCSGTFRVYVAHGVKIAKNASIFVALNMYRGPAEWSIAVNYIFCSSCMLKPKLVGENAMLYADNPELVADNAKLHAENHNIDCEPLSCRLEPTVLR